MQDRVSTRTKVGIAVWGLLWLISASGLVQLYIELHS